MTQKTQHPYLRRGIEAVRVTLQLLRRCKEERGTAYVQAQVNCAINRRAGLPNGRKYDDHYQLLYRRDQQRLKDIHRHIRVYQFETAECRRRFSHLLSHYDD